MSVYNTIVIGGGAAGLSSSIFLARSEITHVTFSENEKGSMLSTTSIVENYPGYPEGIDGRQLIENFQIQSQKYGTIIIPKLITRVDFSSKPFRVYDSDNIEYKSSSIIIATGSIPNKLHLENEDKLWGKYISSCAICDGPNFKNKKVVVIGGGEASLEIAIFLTKFSDVTLIHRRNTFRASVVMQKRVLNHPKIKVIFDHNVIKLNTVKDKYGLRQSMKIKTKNEEEERLSSIIIKNNKTKEEEEVEADILFYALGFKPNSELFKGILEMDANNYIVKKPHDHFKTITSIEGVFVAGDVSDPNYRLAITCASNGCQAAIDANDYLHEMHIVENTSFC